MDIRIRKWKLEDKTALAENLNNQKVMDNLRDGLPYPYTENDAEGFIKAMLSADVLRVAEVGLTDPYSLRRR